MKLVEMKCKHCNAVLKIDPDATEIKCEYCGARYKLDDEAIHHKLDDAEKVGYELEKGKMRAHAEANAELNIKNAERLASKKKTELYLTVCGGFLGIHKFAQGKILMGIIYLFTFGLFFIGWIADSIKVAGEYGDAVEDAGGDRKEATGSVFRAIGMLLLWIMFLPIMETYYVWKSTKLDKTTKILITIAIWTLMLIGFAKV